MNAPGVLLRPWAARVAGLALACATGFAGAASPGTDFTHKDWSLSCDNTGTCRASGYEADSNIELAVSVLLTRTAGPGTPVEAKVTFGDFNQGAGHPAGPVRLTLGGRAVGNVAENEPLAPPQVAALLRTLLGSGEIVFSAGRTSWRLSGDGAAAVLLKMDDVQGRVGTPGALVRKGSRPESAVAGPARPPVIEAVAVAPSSEADLPLARRVLATIAKSEDCPEAENYRVEDRDNVELARLWRLGGGRVLVTALCWRAAYNAGNGYWIAHDKPPYDAKLVTAMADGFDPEQGELSFSMKGRGVGDCMSTSSWIWNGRDFVHAGESTSGQCKGVAAGGAWQLPTLVSEVRKPR
jgi:hypothetical protein